DKRNCQTKCAKEIDHDDEHICQSKRHNCGAPCSLQANTKKGSYKCPNKCIIPCEDEHERHCCENDSACPIQCLIPDCQRRCQCTDHFHALQSQQIHFCGYVLHQCQEDCQELGICRVLTEPRKQEEVYQGLVQETSITFTKYIQLSERIKCCKKIPPNAFHHDGKHTHDEGGFHYCDAQYYCQDSSTCKSNANKQHIDVQEQEMFEKCDHECADEIHQPTKGSNIIPNRSFCELPLFHAPLKLSDAPPNANVIIFLSDGGCRTPKSQLEEICKYNSDKGDNPSLREMAEIAGRYNPANKIGNALRCHFTSTMSEINLVNTFTGVAE
ncbi:9819_t:CDS:2, partial [Racocetra fulgida]